MLASHSNCRVLPRLLISVVAASLLLAFNLTSTTLQAQTTEDRSIALGLFEQGRKLRAEGQYAGAASKFEGASKLMRTYGILLNLAECYEQLGRLASAWSTWREAEFVARSQQKADDETRAAKRVRELEPQLSYLTIMVAQQDRPPSLTITCNGTPVPSAAWSSPLPLDPGPQHIIASATGHRSWQTELVLGGRADKQVIQVGALEAESTLPPVGNATVQPAAIVRAEPSSPVQAPAHDPPAARRGMPRWLGPTVGATGIATAVVGVIVWKTGQSKIDNALAQANQAIAGVDREHYIASGNEYSSGKSQRNAGIVTTCVGAALAGTGVALFLLQPQSTEAPKTGKLRLDAWFDRQGGGASVATLFR